MKKLYAIAVLVALTVPVLAWSASPYVSSFKDGKYDMTITSVIPDLNNKKGTAEVKHVGDKVQITVKYPGGEEKWTVSDTTLMQEEIDKGKVVLTYGATSKGTPTPTSQTFNINCKNGKCDADVSAKNNWNISTTPDSITYKVIGTPKDKQNEEAKLRHTFTMKLAK